MTICDLCKETTKKRIGLQELQRKLTGQDPRKVTENNAEIARLQEYEGFMMCNKCENQLVAIALPILTAEEKDNACINCFSEGMTLYREMKRTGSVKDAKHLLKLGSKCHECVKKLCKKTKNKHVCFAVREVQEKVDHVIKTLNKGGKQLNKIKKKLN